MAPPPRLAVARGDRTSCSEEVRALAAERDAVILAHNYQVPGGPGRRRLRRRLARALARGRGRRGRDDRLLRRALHGRDRVDPVPREDRADPRPRRRLLAGGVDRRRAARGLARAVPRGRRRDVREHDRRGEGADRLLLHVRERRGGRAPHLRHPRPGHRDPVRPGHVARRLRREGARPAHARVGRRVPRARRHPPGRHRGHARRAPRRRLPDPPRVRLLDERDGVRGRRRRLRRGRAHALHRRDAQVRAESARARRAAAPRPSARPSARAGARGGRGDRGRACSTRCRWPRPTSTSSPPTRRPRACT